MQTSARNRFAGTVKELVTGPVSTEVTITVAPGVDVVSIISTRSAASLALAVGKPAYAIIKASSVIVGVD
jgi:molybdopterin-binding protein